MKKIISSIKEVINLSLVITEKERKSFKKELGVIRLSCSFMSLTFLFFFLFLDKISYETVLSIYTFITSEYFKITIAILSIYILIGSIVLRNFTYVFAICFFLFGQFLFVHVLDDDYSIDSKPSKTHENPLPKKHYYPIFWNVG